MGAADGYLQTGRCSISRLREFLVHFTDRVLPGAVLAILLLYTYVRVFEHPYAGFRWQQDGTIDRVFASAWKDLLHVGDRLVQIGSEGWADIEADYQAIPFSGVKPGQEISLVIERNGQPITISSIFPGWNADELVDQIVSEFWLAYLFWFLGTLALLYLRPRGSTWVLAIAFYYLTAVWIGAEGAASFYHLAYSAFVFRVVLWLCVPLYLHVHWMLPQPLGKLPNAVVCGGYLAGALLGWLDCFRILPSNAYWYGLILAVGGSLVLLLLHIILAPESRLSVRRLLMSVSVAVLPLISARVAGNLLPPTVGSVLGLYPLSLIPFAYFYWMLRRQFADWESRINAISTVNTFLVVLAEIQLPVVAYLSRQPVALGDVIIPAFVGYFTALATILLFPAWQSFADAQLLRLPAGPLALTDRYASRIGTVNTVPELAEFIKDDFFPSFLVRQFAFLHFDGGQVRTISSTAVEAMEVPGSPELLKLLALAGTDPVLGFESSAAYPWVRVIMPLKAEGSTIGVWLLGHREPDDMYPRPLIHLFETVANLVAITLSRIVHTERLRVLYETNVTRHEEERLRIALRLHDSILNQLAAMRMAMDSSAVTPAFKSSYDELVSRVRDVASELRPPMLSFGLLPAIIDLADAHMERGGHEARIVVEIPSTDTRYAPQVELHVFRIVQESCENAVHHARAKTISIVGRLDPQQIEIHVNDDGVGFDLPDGLAMENWIIQKHFGLAGMVERAHLIGAQVTIESAAGEGTQISVTWRAGQV